MGRYSGSSSQRESSVRKPKQPHGIWRGIGCLMMIIVPAISILIGIQVVNTALANRWRIPTQLLGYPQLPDIVYKIGGLRDLLAPLTRIQNLNAYIVASLICMMVISAVVSMIYAVVYRIVNPVRYGPMDEPPPKIKAKKYTR
jgi:hypothetical protein